MPLNYAGPHGMLSGDSMSLRFFHKLGATQLFRGALCGGVRSEAWVWHVRRRARHRPRGGRGREAQRAVGQQRDGHQPAPRAADPRGQAPRRPAGGHRSAAQQDRRAGGPASRPAARHRRVSASPWPTELERLGAHDRAFIADMSAATTISCVVPANGRRTRPRKPAASPANRSTRSPMDGRCRSAGDAPGNGLERGRNGGSGIRAAIALPALLGKLDRTAASCSAPRSAFPRRPRS